MSDDIEGRILLHQFSQEKEKIFEEHSDLTDMETYIDIEALKLSNEEMATHGRVVSTPKALARKASENVRSTIAKKRASIGENDEYVKFWRNLSDRVTRPRR